MTHAELAAAWRQAKYAEEAARTQRYAVEELIVAALPLQGTNEGTAGTVIGDTRLRVTYGLDRKVDSDGLQRQWGTLTAPARDAFRWKAEAKLRELRALQSIAPEQYRLVAPFIETKPKKPAVSVETLKED